MKTWQPQGRVPGTSLKQGRSESSGFFTYWDAPPFWDIPRSAWQKILMLRASLSQFIYSASDASPPETKSRARWEQISPRSEIWLLSATSWGATSFTPGQLNRCKTRAKLQSSSSLRNVLWMNQSFVCVGRADLSNKDSRSSRREIKRQTRRRLSERLKQKLVMCSSIY